MKKMMVMVALMVAGSVAYAAPSSSVNVKERKEKSLVILTPDKTMRGGHVQVYHSNGDLVAAQKLIRRRMVIDFCDVKEGSYRIVVTNNGRTEEFQFEKR